LNRKTLKIPLQQYLRLFRTYLSGQWKRIAWLAALLLAGLAMQLVSPQILRSFIDSAKREAGLVTLLYAAAWFIAVSLLQQGLSVAAAYLSENIGWITTNQLRKDVAAHCLKLDLSFHKSRTSGSLVERVDGDINSLSNFFSSFVIALMSNLLLVAGILVFLYRENWLIGGGLTLFVLLAIWAIQHIRRYVAPYWGGLRQISADFYGFVGEHLEGTEDTRANGATGYVMQRFFLLLRQWLPIRIRAFLGWCVMWNTTIFVFALGNAVAFAICAYLWNKGSLTLGTVYMIVYYTELLGKPIEQIRTQLQDLQKADASIARVRELLDTRSAIEDGPGTPLPGGPLSVRFDGVCFGYDEGTDTLREISFRLKPGKVLGVLGRTGSGKTTLVRLLLRFYDPREGAVYLGGVNIRDAKVKELRERIGFVTQAIEIFQGTVRDNLTFYDRTIPDRRIHEVLFELGLGSWLESLPAGLDTELESGGGGLSAGEAQLIAFARVFLRDPGLVILDEASSRLDPATEQHIDRAIDRLLKNRTCIMIAHRLATVERADEILILEDGVIREHGERRELAADRSSRFSRMLSAGLEEVAQ